MSKQTIFTIFDTDETRPSSGLVLRMKADDPGSKQTIFLRLNLSLQTILFNFSRDEGDDPVGGQAVRGSLIVMCCIQFAAY